MLRYSSRTSLGLTDRLRIRLITDRRCCDFLVIRVVCCSKVSLRSVIPRYLIEGTIATASHLTSLG